MGNLIKFPRARTTATNHNERHKYMRIQDAIKSVRYEYYKENLKKFNKNYARNLMVQRVVEFIRKQWVIYDNEILARLSSSE